MAKTAQKLIKPIENYTGLSDGEVAARATAVQTAMTGNANYANPPVDLTIFKTVIDLFNTLIAEALDGSKKVIAQKDKQRDVVIKDLRLLGRYVEVTSNGDSTIFQSSGFQPASVARTRPQVLSQNIRSIDHGAVSGQILVRLKAVPNAASYEFRYAPSNNGTATSGWTTLSLVKTNVTVSLTGLTPGTTYAFQVRSLDQTGYSDWSDPLTFICT